MTIKDLERNIVYLGVDPAEISHSWSLLWKKDNDISPLKKKLNIPGENPVQTLELVMAQKQSEKIYAMLRNKFPSSAWKEHKETRNSNTCLNNE